MPQVLGLAYFKKNSDSSLFENSDCSSLLIFNIYNVGKSLLNSFPRLQSRRIDLLVWGKIGFLLYPHDSIHLDAITILKQNWIYNILEDHVRQFFNCIILNSVLFRSLSISRRVSEDKHFSFPDPRFVWSKLITFLLTRI